MRRIAVLSMIWGWSFLFIKVAVAGFTPPTVAWIRVTLGAALLVTVIRVRGRSLPSEPGLWLHFLVVGLAGAAIPFSLLAWGEERITSALTAVLNGSTPLFTAAFALWLNRERFTLAQLGGLVFGLGGVAVAAGVGRSDLAGSTITGALAAVGAAVAYGIGYTYAKRHLGHLEPIVAAGGQLVMASATLLPLAAVTTAADGVDPSPTRLVSLLILGLAGTGVALLIHYGVIRDLGATKASLVTYLVPVVAITVGVVALDEPLTSRLAIGAVIVIASVAAVTQTTLPRPRLRRRMPVAPVALIALLLLVACGDGAETDAAAGATTTTVAAAALETTTPAAVCGDVITDAVDPASGLHLVAGQPEPTFLSEPPTSGPHDSRPLDAPVQSEPLARARQVGQLEAGHVLLQHREVDADVRAALEARAGDDVIVAPNDDLPAPIVASAWVHRLECQSLDAAALDEFIATYAGHGPDGAGHG